MSKKTILTVLLAVIAISVYSQTGVIRELTGEVELKHAGSSVFVPAREGSQIARDTIVSTGFKSTAIIAVGSNVITVRPLTRLAFSEISSSAGTENLNVNLQAGNVRVDVRPAAGTRANTSVQSPSATASVRGTSFEMDAGNIFVHEGRVSWTDNFGLSTSVAASQAGGISADGGVVDPQAMAAAELMPPSPGGAGEAGESIGPTPEAPPLGEVNFNFIFN